MYFWTYGLGKRWLDKRLKSLVSEDPWTINIVNGPKRCRNVNNSTFTIFADHRKDMSSWKNLSEGYAKS